MKKPLINLFSILFITLSSFLILCTISENNGTPSVSGPENDTNNSSSTVDSTMYFQIQNIMPVKSGDTTTINIALFKDSTLTKYEAGISIIVSVGSGAWISSDTLITNSYGATSFKFSHTLSSATEQTVSLSFAYNNQISNTSVTVSDEPTTLNQNFMVISASPYNINADGSSQSTVSVKIKNENFNPIVGETIIFKTDAGDITASSTTNDAGIAIATLTSERRNDIANITATMLTDSTKKVGIKVEFSGIKISSSIDRESISPNGLDSAIITMTLKDANENEIYGERVYFTTSSSSVASLEIIDTTTDTRGQAKCIVKASATTSTSDTITIRCAGDSSKAIIYYSDNILLINIVSNSTLLANGTDTTGFTITYTNSDSVTGVGAGAIIHISVTAGTIGLDSSSTLIDTTNLSSKISFKLNNPNFATTVTITATASYGGRITSSKANIYFKASDISQIFLEGTPEVIDPNGDKCSIKAICLDSNNNKINNETISFRIIDGPGAGEYLDPPTSKTNLSGTAFSNLYSGTESSKQQEIKVVAESFSGIVSDTLFLTIAGTPEYITIRKNIGEISDNNDGTYTKNLSALVTDINRNPVKDSTLVTFSSQIVGYWITKKISITTLNSVTTIDSTIMLPFNDQNNNYKWDEGENKTDNTSDPRFDTITINGSSIKKGYPLYRGEDLVWFDGDNKYNPGPLYYDINRNGRRDYDSTLWNWQAPEASVTYTEYDTTYINDTSSTIDTIIATIITKWADNNGNGELDLIEPLVNASDSVDYELESKGFIPGIGYPDYDWSNNDQPDPITTVIIEKSVPTEKGVAPNFLTYGQSDALRIELKIWAESKGKTSKTPIVFTLPILKSDAEYFEPYEGKLYK